MKRTKSNNLDRKSINPTPTRWFLGQIFFLRAAGFNIFNLIFVPILGGVVEESTLTNFQTFLTIEFEDIHIAV